MVFGLGKKQEAQPQQMMKPSRVPTDKVLEMRAQGVSNNQIIQILQRDGHDLTAIFNAMNQADVKGGIDFGNLGPGTPLGGEMGQGFGQTGQTAMQETGGSFMPQQQMQQQMQQMQAPVFPEAQMPAGEEYGAGATQIQDMGGLPQAPEQPMEMGPQPMSPMGMGGMGYGAPAANFEAQRIEELAEAIIDEKWNEIVRSINKIIDWKERVEARVTKMEQQLDDMNKNFEMLHKGVLGKITDYDKNLTNVGAEIKAMEKVFQKVLPTLTENVAELSRITNNAKRK